MEELNEPSQAYSPETHKHGALTEQIIRIFYDVYNTLGHGFLEKVYENALALRLRKAGLKVVQQQPITVYFDNEVVGEYFADLIVDDTIVIELKAAAQLAPEHHAQLLNYLKATLYEVGLLLNFGPKPELVRKAYDNARKRIGR
jgi:GxxExxY protein